jgi:lipopolysaccharide transport protein LptA
VRRLNFFRILLPVALLIFLAVLFYALRPPTSVHRDTDEGEEESIRKAEDFRFVELLRDRAVLDFVAEIVEQGEDGKVNLENITRFVIDRLDGHPLEVSSALGEYEGEAGERIIRFEKEVRIYDPVDDLTLAMPSLVVDEAAGEARSDSGLTIEGPTIIGKGSALVYGLNEQPTLLSDPDLRDPRGGSLRAERALLLDGLDDVQFEGQVRAERGEEYLNAGILRLVRGEQGRLGRAAAEGAVRSAIAVGEGLNAELSGEKLDVDWDDAGNLRSFSLEGDALVRHGAESLSAASIDAAVTDAGEQGLEVEARGTVFVRGAFSGGPAWLRADSLEAFFDRRFELRSAVADGNARFEGDQTRAEAGRASYRLLADGESEIELRATTRRKARLAQGRTRVAAASIVTDPRGSNMKAAGEVEATMLPAESGESAAGISGMFLEDEAIHFVSASLTGEDSGNRLTFQGGVRGWQGERNLSAETVILDQRDSTIEALQNVNTRIPRYKDRAALTEDDYMQIASDRLEYAESARRAEYSGHVRVRLAEGWMEAERMEVLLSPDGDGVLDVQAYDSVQIEFRDSEGDGTPTMISGKADRLSYTPADETIRLYGDKAPAAVRRMGEQEGTTTGRVLRYQLDTGTLEVDSGDQGPAIIRTTGE